MSQITKKAMATALKELLSEKPLDKITVVDLAERCGVNRKTFYYHFKDIYDLIDWIFLGEVQEALDGKRSYETWRQGALQVLKYAAENRQLVINAYHSINRNQLIDYLYKLNYKLVMGVVEEQSAGRNIPREDQEFVADFYKFAFVGLIQDWIKTGMQADPEKIIDKLWITIHGNIARALDGFER